jgi:hypothetical protein
MNTQTLLLDSLNTRCDPLKTADLLEVALQELADFGEIAPVGYNPKPARADYKEHHAIALSRYIEDKGEIIAFWRPVPDQPFPEEK